MPCPRREACHLPAAIPSRLALLLWQRKYCDTESRFEECQPFRLAQAGETVPDRMLPNGYRLGEPLPAGE